MAEKIVAEWPDYKIEAEKCLEFISGFEDDGVKKYISLLQRVANRQEKVVNIELDDVLAFQDDEEFVQNIMNNTRRYISLFEDAVDALLPAPSINFEDSDVLDVLLEQRLSNTQANNEDGAPNDSLPKIIRRRFQLNILPKSLDKTVNLRDVKAKYVGKLVKVKGVITRMSDVKPLIQVATYTCDFCGHEVYQEVKGNNYTPLKECASQVCRTNTSKGRLFPQTRGSKFLKYQKLKLQEMPGEVPVGHIPRSINVIATGEHTRKCVPGDMVTISGIFLVTKYTGYRAIRAGLTADTYVEVMDIENRKKSFKEAEFSDEVVAKVKRASRDHNIYSKLAKSIAPEIYGHEDVKKALLLLLVGAPTRVMKDGMKIRGDINILLMGDPGVAKSQLLKHISTVAPRGVYTTGKGSSGVGLTAAVVRDQLSGEVTLEGGALVLADMGVCCIDEFDKMEEADRTAIHEVMEQQTVSIAKAGITTTLNARTSVLAAANPRWGRYDLSKSPEVNINLPTALLSRFDLTFLLLDQPNEDSDKLLAAHITHVHRTQQHPPLSFRPYDSDFLRAYVATARRFNPFVPKELTNYIVGTYVEMRGEKDEDDVTRTRFCTARSLLSILRLAQGLARLRMADEVEEQDVVEACRLLYVTKAQATEEQKETKDKMSSVFAILENLYNSLSEKQRHKGIKYADALNRAAVRGFSEEDLRGCLEFYQNLQLLSTSQRGHRIFLSAHN